MKELREAEIEQYLVDRVMVIGGEVRKVKWLGRRGAPDRCVMLPASTKAQFGEGGQTIWIELKRPGARADPHQIREHVRMRRMGQRVEVVDSFERVDEVLG